MLRILPPSRSNMSDEALHVDFATAALPSRLRWLHEPARWRVDTEAQALVVAPDADTDYWQRTHYGFRADNGHALLLEVAGDFVLTTRVVARPVHQYDQAGLMLRLSPQCWLKTSVEHEPDGADRLGAVVTNDGWSDWSTQSLPRGIDTLDFRLRAEGDDCIVEASFDERGWQQLRIAHLAERSAVASVQCGLYACSPKAAGFEARFAFLDLRPGRLG